MWTRTWTSPGLCLYSTTTIMSTSWRCSRGTWFCTSRRNSSTDVPLLLSGDITTLSLLIISRFMAGTIRGWTDLFGRGLRCFLLYCSFLFALHNVTMYIYMHYHLCTVCSTNDTNKIDSFMRPHTVTPLLILLSMYNERLVAVGVHCSYWGLLGQLDS